MSIRTDNSFDSKRRTIEPLQERRTALISAAVTGNIDVWRFDAQEAQ